MKIRLVEVTVDGALLRCPFVICEKCKMEIRPHEGVDAVVSVAQETLGDVYHGRCVGRLTPYRMLGNWLSQIMANSLGGP